MKHEAKDDIMLQIETMKREVRDQLEGKVDEEYINLITDLGILDKWWYHEYIRPYIDYFIIDAVWDRLVEQYVENSMAVWGFVGYWGIVFILICFTINRTVALIRYLIRQEIKARKEEARLKELKLKKQNFQSKASKTSNQSSPKKDQGDIITKRQTFGTLSTALKQYFFGKSKQTKEADEIEDWRNRVEDIGDLLIRARFLQYYGDIEGVDPSKAYLKQLIQHERESIAEREEKFKQHEEREERHFPDYSEIYKITMSANALIINKGGIVEKISKTKLEDDVEKFKRAVKGDFSGLTSKEQIEMKDKIASIVRRGYKCETPELLQYFKKDHEDYTGNKNSITEPRISQEDTLLASEYKIPKTKQKAEKVLENKKDKKAQALLELPIITQNPFSKNKVKNNQENKKHQNTSNNSNKQNEKKAENETNKPNRPNQDHSQEKQRDQKKEGQHKMEAQQQKENIQTFRDSEQKGKVNSRKSKENEWKFYDELL